MTKLIKLNIPVIVEGRYDKARLSGVVDAVIIPTDGFGVFRNEEKRSLIKSLGKNGLILLCDSDGGGVQIRSRLKDYLASVDVYDLYIPQLPGKEKRKAAPSKAGYLGVEGVPNEILAGIFEGFIARYPQFSCGDALPREDIIPGGEITKSLMYELGLNGGAGSSAARDAMCGVLGLPRGMSVNALCAALNLVTTKEKLTEICLKSPENQK